MCWEAGLSDFYRMTASALKLHFRKIPTKVISHRDLKIFDNEKFVFSLVSVLFDKNHKNNVDNPGIFF